MALADLIGLAFAGPIRKKRTRSARLSFRETFLKAKARSPTGERAFLFRRKQKADVETGHYII